MMRRSSFLHQHQARRFGGSVCQANRFASKALLALMDSINLDFWQQPLVECRELAIHWLLRASSQKPPI